MIIPMLVTLMTPLLGQDAPRNISFIQQVTDLGSDDFRVRERAHAQLREAGEEAREALEGAVERSTDAEVRERATILLRRMGAGPRIAEAIGQLGSDSWDEVRTGIQTLCSELGEGTGAEEALGKACEGPARVAKMARVLRQQWANWERQQQNLIRNTSFQQAQFMRQYYANFRQNMKRSVEIMCKSEFERAHVKKESAEKQDAER